MKIFILQVAVVFLFLSCQSTIKQPVKQPVKQAVKNSQPIEIAVPVSNASTTEATQLIQNSASNNSAREWKSVCRKNINETGQRVKNSKTQSLQSSYVFEGQKLTWYVKSYKDLNCSSLLTGSRSVFDCDLDPTEKTSKCTQKSSALWKDNKWESQKMIDYAGYPNILVMQYRLKILTTEKAQLISLSISDDGEEEIQELN